MRNPRFYRKQFEEQESEEVHRIDLCGSPRYTEAVVIEYPNDQADSEHFLARGVRDTEAGEYCNGELCEASLLGPIPKEKVGYGSDDVIGEHKGVFIQGAWVPENIGRREKIFLERQINGEYGRPALLEYDGPSGLIMEHPDNYRDVEGALEAPSLEDTVDKLLESECILAEIDWIE